jgi:hypothetical protein
MVEAPAQWLIRAIAYLPDALRPGVFLALLVAVFWFVVVRKGVAELWRGTWRGVAWLIDVTVRLALLPEYAITTARRRRGDAPGRLALLMAGPSETVLDGAVSLHERHERRTERSKKRPPWKLCAFVVITVAAAWVTMDSLAAGEPAKRQLAQVYERWRDVEAWADVRPGQRAAAGERGVFKVGRPRRDGLTARVTARCPGEASCAGVIIARNRYGVELASMPLAVDARAAKTVKLILARGAPGSVRGLHVVVDQR